MPAALWLPPVNIPILVGVTGKRKTRLDKLGVSDRLELALYCLHNKIIQADVDEETVAKKIVSR